MAPMFSKMLVAGVATANAAWLKLHDNNGPKVSAARALYLPSTGYGFSEAQERMLPTTLHEAQDYDFSPLVTVIKDLRKKREELNKQILKEEERKGNIQKGLSILTDRLQKSKEWLVRKTQARNAYDETIQETTAAYREILESSQTLTDESGVLDAQDKMKLA